MLSIRMARRCGAPWRELAHPLGVTTYQGAEQVLLRLESLFDGNDGTRDERMGRKLRRRPRRPSTPSAGPASDDRAAVELRAALGQMLALEELLPDDLADDVLDLRREVTPKRAEMTGVQLGHALRVIANDMRGREWPPPVQAALDRIVAAMAT